MIEPTGNNIERPKELLVQLKTNPATLQPMTELANLSVPKAQKSARLPRELFAQMAKEMELRRQEETHWIRKKIQHIFGVLIENPITNTFVSLSKAVGSAFVWVAKQSVYYTFRLAVVPIANIIWNKHSISLSKSAWNHLASPTLDLALNNVEAFKNSKLQKFITTFATTASFLLWDNIVAKGIIFLGKTTATIVGKALFLWMEGILPTTPMQAAKFIPNSTGQKLAALAYHTSYLAGLAAGVAWYTLGGASLTLAGTATLLAAPSLAAFANRLVMFTFSKVPQEKPGLKGLQTQIIGKLDLPFVELLKSEEAFSLKLLKNPKTDEPIDFFISGPNPKLATFLTKFFSNKYNTPHVAGLVSYAIDIGQAMQDEAGYGKRLLIKDALEIAIQKANEVENSQGLLAAYPNGTASISLCVALKNVLIKLNPIGYSQIHSSHRKRMYMKELVEVLAPQVIDKLKVTTEVITQKNSEEVLTNLFTDSVGNQAIPIPVLELNTWKPTLPGLLIDLGRLIGGFASVPGSIVTTSGHMIRALHKVFLGNEQIHKPLSLDNLRQIKGDLDRIVNTANNGEELLLQFFTVAHSFINTLEKGLKPFAAALGQSTVDAIIMNTPVVAQNQMNSVNAETSSSFMLTKEDQQQAYTKEYQEQALKVVDDFWKERGDQIIPDNFNVSRTHRSWQHWLLSAVLYPKRTASAVSSAIKQMAAGDREANLLIDGMRIYFESKIPELLSQNFDKLRVFVDATEKFLRAKN